MTLDTAPPPHHHQPPPPKSVTVPAPAIVVHPTKKNGDANHSLSSTTDQPHDRSSDDYSEARVEFVRARRAIRALQSARRRRTWRQAIDHLMRHGLPLVHAPCCFGACCGPMLCPPAHPIYQKSELIGIEGPSSKRYAKGTLVHLACLHPSALPRRLIIFFVEHPAFEAASLIAVLANCVVK